MLALLLALAPTPLSPPNPPAEIELTWVAPEGCPSGDDVVARYRELLTVDPAGNGLMVAEAEVVDEGDGAWRLELTTRMGDYTDVRKLRANRCEELAEASAMLFAVALEPTLEALSAPDPAPAEPEPEPPEPEPEPTPEPETPDPTPPVIVESPPASTPPEAEPERKPVYLTATAGPEWGAVPGVTARLSAGAGMVWKWARFEGDLAWFAPRDEPGTRGPGRIQLASAAVRGCGAPGTGRWVFPVCVGVEAGATIASVVRSEGRRTIAAPRVAPLLRAGAVLQGRRLGGFAALEGAGPVFGTEIRIDDETIFSRNIGSLRGMIGLEVYFF